MATSWSCPFGRCTRVWHFSPSIVVRCTAAVGSNPDIEATSTNSRPLSLRRRWPTRRRTPGLPAAASQARERTSFAAAKKILANKALSDESYGTAKKFVHPSKQH
jgi:hypothetical protein